MNEYSHSILTPGMIIGQRYEILRLLRAESHGEVWLARDQVLDVDVGLKFLANGQPEFERFLEYYRREALWGLKMHHPQILGVHHLDEGADGVFLVQEPFMGNSLGEMFGQTEHLTLPDALYFIEVLAQGLAHGHKQGISHQNFNPQQVLVSATDGIKIINFAFPAESAEIAAMPELRAYIPPEVWEGRQTVPASNLFSLGVMGYQMLTGTFPYPLQGEGSVPYRLSAPQGKLAELPEAFRPLMNRCLKADPERRFQSAAEFLARLAVLREKLFPTSVVPDLRVEEDWHTQPLAGETAQPLKIMPLEPEVEINPAWEEAPPRRPTTSAWQAGNNWVLAQRQRWADYFGPEPLRRNRRKQLGAALGGAAGLLVIIIGLSALFSPTAKPKAVIATADQIVKESSVPTLQSPADSKPAFLTAAPAPAAPAEGEGTASQTTDRSAATTTSTPGPVLPEPANAVKPTAPAAAVRPEKPVVRPAKPLVQATPKTEKVPPKTAVKPIAAKRPAPTTGPKLLATFDKETAARQKADALTKQGQRAVVKKARQGKKTVYQVWLAAVAPTPVAKPKPNAKTAASR
ncbi:MAG: protein kinase domain-containing protein [Desulfobacca sp.]|uniref:protein kinase domain-containing protein n=1 Tax=Desulfobacca sp. TaxID=2067990 RepID=UPI0040494208